MYEKEFDDLRAFKNRLGGNEDEAWVFGVCASIARKTKWETWRVRLVCLLALIVFTSYTLIAYIILGFVMEDTRSLSLRRTKALFNKLEKLSKSLWRSINSPTKESGSNRYE